MNPIYLDYAATTPVDRDIAELAAKYMTREYYNPASAHACGQRALSLLENARAELADAIGCVPRELVFTSSGTEAVNLALKSITYGRVAVSAIEHDAALSCARHLESRGVAVDYIEPDEHGIIMPKSLKAALNPDTRLVRVMAVNNIIGAVQPIKELAEIAHTAGALFFTDAVQAVNGTKINVKDSGVDMLCASGHKFYAPKGVGFLYARRGVKLAPQIEGGEQEYGLRAGTVDVPSACALVRAFIKAQAHVDEYNAHTEIVSDAFIKHLKYGKPIICPTRTNDIISVVFDGINGNRLAVALSMAGVCCSVGSACSAGSQTPPQTLLHMPVAAESSVRFSFGKRTSVAQAVRAARIVNETVQRFM